MAATNISRDLVSINSQIEHKVDAINGLAARIAGFNGQISTIELSGTSANDLRDKRDLLLEELAGIVDINVTETIRARSMSTSAGLSSSRQQDIRAYHGADQGPDSLSLMLNGGTINNRISGGSLKGDLEGIAQYKDARDRVNLLSASIVKEVNLAHSAGYGLDGSTGADFFSPLSVYANANSANTGGAAITTGTVTGLSALTLDDYEIRFSGPGAYNVVNLETDAVVTGGAYTSGSAITFDGLSVVISHGSKTPQAGDRFVVSATRNAAIEMGVEVTDPRKIAASATLAGLPGDNVNAMAMADLRRRLC
jgi:flagellar hook-associated protein 1 FlgK